MPSENFSLVDQFKDIKGSRIVRTREHKLIDIIVIAICAVVAGEDGFDVIEIFAKSHQDWLKKFLEFLGGIPSHDTFALFESSTKGGRSIVTV